MRKYEIMYILDQDAKDIKAVEKKLTDILIADGGKIVESAEWGLKDFAYEINHKKKGHYFVVIVETLPANINEFQRIAGIDKDVVRTMVINTESEKRYEQSTKLSKTDMTKFREEKKQSRDFKRGPRFENQGDSRRDDNRNAEKPATSKPASTEKPAAKAEVKPTTSENETK